MNDSGIRVFRRCGGCGKKQEYELFLENDEELALKYGNDMGFLKRNNAEFK